MASKITKEKYFKTLEHFTVEEWLLLGLEGGLQMTDLQNFTTKKELINHIGISCTKFFEDFSRQIFFKSIETNGKETLTIIMDEPLDQKSYKEKKNTRWMLTEAEIRAIIGKTAADVKATTADMSSPVSYTHLTLPTSQLV